MAPLLVSDPHDKALLSPDDYFEDEQFDCYEASTITLGPDDTQFEYKICFSEKSGAGFVVITDMTATTIIGNLVFKATSDALAELTGASSVQISSVIIDDEYRGLTLGVKAYEKLAEYFHIISDDVQTVDGAALWKNKISKADSLNVQIIIDYDTKPQILLNNNDQAEIYTPDKTELEKLIWSAKNIGTAELANGLGIDSPVGVHNKSKVLFAKSSRKRNKH